MTAVRFAKLFRPATCVALLAACGVAVTLQAQASATPPAQEKERPIPKVVKKDGRYAFMVDGAPFLMLGAQAHNSSGWPGMLPKVWPAIEYLHANTLEIPVYWEQIEPARGSSTFRWSIPSSPRRATTTSGWIFSGSAPGRTAASTTCREWMKADPAKYFHLIDKNGRPADSPSPFCTASPGVGYPRVHRVHAPPQGVRPAAYRNHRAGGERVRHVGITRDYSPAAQKLFEAPVPAEVLKAMGKEGGDPENWTAAFGAEAEVNFHAWAVATYVGKVAAAGKAVYPLPLYANAALRDPIKPGAPGNYEAGGPTDNVIPIWKVAAPAIDIESPDIYMNDPVAYLKVLELYHRDDNPLFIPETSGGAAVARFFFSALGLQAIGFSPFGLDYSDDPIRSAAAPADRPAAALPPPPPAAAPPPRRPHCRTNSPPRRRTTGLSAL